MTNVNPVPYAYTMTKHKCLDNPYSFEKGDIITIKAQGRATSATVVVNNRRKREIVITFRIKRAKSRPVIKRTIPYNQLKGLEPRSLPISKIILGFVTLASGGVAFTQYEAVLIILQKVIQGLGY